MMQIDISRLQKDISEIQGWWEGFKKNFADTALNELRDIGFRGEHQRAVNAAVDALEAKFEAFHKDFKNFMETLLTILKEEQNFVDSDCFTTMFGDIDKAISEEVITIQRTGKFFGK